MAQREPFTFVPLVYNGPRPVVTLPLFDHAEGMIKKTLSRADINENARLLVPKNFVENCIFPLRDHGFAEQCKTDGVTIQVVDEDEDDGFQDNLCLKKRKDNGSYVLQGHWRSIVSKKNLKEGDEIEITWDGSRLKIKVLERN